MSELGLAIVLIVFYMLPSVIAQSRNHHSYHAIVAINILLGWTFVGWVAALVWALTGTRMPHAATHSDATRTVH